MKYRLLAVLVLALYACNNKEKPIEKGERTIVEIELPEGFDKNLIHLESTPFYYTIRALWKSERPQRKGNFVKWTLFCDSPRLVNLVAILGKGNKTDLYEPGDSVHVNMKGSKPIFSGKNTDKFKMQQEMNDQESLIPVPQNPKFSSTNSLQDYLEWSKYLDAKMQLRNSILEAYKKNITPFAFDYLKADEIGEIEYMRLRKFSDLETRSADLGITPEMLGTIFDSTTYNENVKWVHTYTGRTKHDVYFYDYARRLVERKYNFDRTNPILNSPRRKIVYAEQAKEIYKGDILQSCLIYLITSRGLKEHSLKSVTPEIDTLLADFYAQPGYPEYKQYVKDYENKIKGWVAMKER